MALATLSIDLEAKLAKFEEGLGKATRVAEKHAADMAAKWQAAGDVAVAAFAALGAGATVAGFISLTRASIDSIDALNDVADATGSTIENISALENAALRTGGNLDDVSGILIKFNGVLKDAKPGSGAEAALKAIGLNAEELRRIDPAEALRQTAVALAGFADDGDKARLVQDLFGKSVKEAAPFLKDLVEQGRLNATVTAEQAEEASKFNKQIASLQTNLSEFTRSIVSGALPALNSLLERFAEASKAGNGTLLDGIFGTSGTGKLEAQAAGISANIDRVIASMERMDTELKRNPGDAQLQTRMEKARARLADLQRQSQQTSQQLKDMANLMDGGPQAAATAGAPEGDRPTVGAIPGAAAKPGAMSEFDKLIGKIREKTSAQQAEAESEKALTAAQSLALDTMVGLRDGTLKLTQAQSARVAKSLEELLAVEQLNEARKSDAKWLDESAKANDAALDAALKGVEATEQQVAAMRRAAEESGLEGRALADLQKGRMLAAAAALEHKAAAMDGLEGYQAMTQAWRDQAAALRELAAETDLADASRKRATDKSSVTGILGQTQQGRVNELQKQYDALANELDRGGISTAQYADALDILDQRFTDITKPIAEAEDKISAFADQAQRNIQTALGGTFENLFRGEFDSIGDLWADMLIKMAAQAAAQGLAETLFGTKGGGSGGGLDWAGLGTSLIGAFTGGGAGFDAGAGDYSIAAMSKLFKKQADGGGWNRGVQFYADGGVFGQPTMFEHSGGLGVLGEAGPEAVMPLRRGADGKLGVASAGGGGMQVAITINQTVGDVVTQAQLAQVAERTRQAAMAGIADAQRRGRGI
jgi:hypothetical protein